MMDGNVSNGNRAETGLAGTGREVEPKRTWDRLTPARRCSIAMLCAERMY